MSQRIKKTTVLPDEWVVELTHYVPPEDWHAFSMLSRQIMLCVRCPQSGVDPSKDNNKPMTWACRNKKIQCIKALLKDSRINFPLAGMGFIFDLDYSDVLDLVYRDARFSACKRFFHAAKECIENYYHPNEQLQSVLLEHLLSYKDVDTRMVRVWGIRYTLKHRRCLIMNVLMKYTNPSLDNNYLIRAACNKNTYVYNFQYDGDKEKFVSDQKKIISILLADDRVLNALTPEQKRLLQSINIAVA